MAGESPFVKAMFEKEFDEKQSYMPREALYRIIRDPNVFTDYRGVPGTSDILSIEAALRLLNTDAAAIPGNIPPLAFLAGMLDAYWNRPILYDPKIDSYEAAMERVDRIAPMGEEGTGRNGGGNGGNGGDGGEIPVLPYEALKLNLENYSGAVMGKVTELTSSLASIGSAYIRDIANHTVGRIMELDREYRLGG